jgi:hypothetical protein
LPAMERPSYAPCMTRKGASITIPFQPNVPQRTVVSVVPGKLPLPRRD